MNDSFYLKVFDFPGAWIAESNILKLNSLFTAEFKLLRNLIPSKINLLESLSYCKKEKHCKCCPVALNCKVTLKFSVVTIQCLKAHKSPGLYLSFSLSFSLIISKMWIFQIDKCEFVKTFHCETPEHFLDCLSDWVQTLYQWLISKMFYIVFQMRKYFMTPERGKRWRFFALTGRDVLHSVKTISGRGERGGFPIKGNTPWCCSLYIREHNNAFLMEI